MSRVQALLFDLGGVVIDIDFERAFHGWQPISALSFEEIRRAFRFDAPYQKRERGEIGEAAYLGQGDVREALRREGMIPA